VIRPESATSVNEASNLPEADPLGRKQDFIGFQKNVGNLGSSQLSGWVERTLINYMTRALLFRADKIAVQTSGDSIRRVVSASAGVSSDARDLQSVGQSAACQILVPQQ